MRAHTESAIPGILALDAIGDPKKFRSQSDFIQFGSLKLAVHSIDPVTVHRPDKDNNLSFMLPMSGSVEYTVNRQKHIAREKLAGVFLTGAGRVVKSTQVSEVVMGLDRNQLLHVADTMFGNKHVTKNPLGLGEDRELLLHQNGQNFNTIFEHLFYVIDAASGNTRLLEMMAIDNALYRIICMLLNPSLLLNETDKRNSKTINNKILELVCEWIEANIENPITLTDLEALSDVSARTLQAMFRKQYQCTPTQWIRSRRLDYAFKRLSNPQSETTVTSVATVYGFNHLSDFSRFYHLRYNEYPAETLCKARNR